MSRPVGTSADSKQLSADPELNYDRRPLAFLIDLKSVQAEILQALFNLLDLRIKNSGQDQTPAGGCHKRRQQLDDGRRRQIRAYEIG